MLTKIFTFIFEKLCGRDRNNVARNYFANSPDDFKTSFVSSLNYSTMVDVVTFIIYSDPKFVDFIFFLRNFFLWSCY